MKTFVFVALFSATLIASGCATSGPPSNSSNAAPGNRLSGNSVAGDGTAPAKTDDVPASVKSAIPNAQTFTTQHKDLSDAQIASIEKDTGGKVSEKDHHSYLGFSNASGTRTQVGAATLVKAAGKEIVIVYDNKDGSPVIKEIKADGLPGTFLSQFAGKGHDDDLLLGVDIKANGAKEDEAKTITDAIRIDVLSMQALYGKAHTH